MCVRLKNKRRKIIKTVHYDLQCASFVDIDNLSMERYEETVINSLCVHIILVACYFPFTPITTLMLISGLTLSLYKVQVLTVAFINFNSFLNPILYCWKIKDIQNVAKETITQFCALLYA